MRFLLKPLLFFITASLLFVACGKDDNEPGFPPVQDGTLRVWAGSTFSYLIKPDNTLWAVGSFYNLNSGTGSGINSEQIETWKKIDSDVRSVAANEAITLMLKTDGTLYTVGNIHENGLGYTTGKFIKLTDNVRTVSTGRFNAYFIKNDHTLWSFGFNDNGELLDGTFTDIKTPKKVLNDVKDVKGGNGWVIVLKTDGTVWTAGANNFHALGSNPNWDAIMPLTKIAENAVSIESSHSATMYLKNDGTLWAAGGNEFGEWGIEIAEGEFHHVKIAENVVKFSSFMDFTYIIKNDNSLWGAGYNSQGQLGLGHNTNEIKFIKITENVKDASAGKEHGLIVKTDGTLWGVGDNLNSQLGLGNTVTKTNKFIQIQIP